MGVVAVALAATLAVFAVQNTTAVPLQFLAYHISGNIWWIAVGAAVLGFLVALLLTLPGRIAEEWRGRSINQQVEQLNQDLSAAHRRRVEADATRRQSQQQSQRLKTQLRDLLSEREDLMAERDRLHDQRNQLRRLLTTARTEPVPAAVMAALSATDLSYWDSPIESDAPREDVAMGPGSNPEDVEAATAAAHADDGERSSPEDRVREPAHGPYAYEHERDTQTPPPVPEDRSDGPAA